MITRAAFCGVKRWSVLVSRMVGKDVIGISFVDLEFSGADQRDAGVGTKDVSLGPIPVRRTTAPSVRVKAKGGTPPASVKRPPAVNGLPGASEALLPYPNIVVDINL